MVMMQERMTDDIGWERGLKGKLKKWKKDISMIFCLRVTRSSEVKFVPRLFIDLLKRHISKLFIYILDGGTNMAATGLFLFGLSYMHNI